MAEKKPELVEGEQVVDACTEMIGYKVPASERDALHKAAKRAGMTVSNFVRVNMRDVLLKVGYLP